MAPRTRSSRGKADSSNDDAIPSLDEMASAMRKERATARRAKAHKAHRIDVDAAVATLVTMASNEAASTEGEAIGAWVIKVDAVVATLVTTASNEAASNEGEAALIKAWVIKRGNGIANDIMATMAKSGQLFVRMCMEHSPIADPDEHPECTDCHVESEVLLPYVNAVLKRQLHGNHCARVASVYHRHVGRDSYCVKGVFIEWGDLTPTDIYQLARMRTRACKACLEKCGAEPFFASP
jgi:hypothetical protein